MKALTLAVLAGFFLSACADMRYSTADEDRAEIRGRYSESGYGDAGYTGSRMTEDPDYYNPRYEMNRHMGGEL